MSLHLRNRPSTVGSNASLRPSTERRFAQRARRRRLLSLRPLLIGFAIIAVIVFLGWLVFGSVFLSVQKVAVSGESRLSAASVKRAAQVPVNKPMVLLDVTAIRHRVEALPQVRSVTVERSWPNTVDITVVERKPVAVVKQNGKPLALVDPTGVLIANVSAVPAGMSVLALSSPGPGDLSTRAALGVVVALPASLRATVAEIQAPTPASVTLKLASGITVVWGDATNSRRKAQALKALLHNQAHPAPNLDSHGRQVPPKKATVFDVSDPTEVTVK